MINVFLFMKTNYEVRTRSKGWVSVYRDVIHSDPFQSFLLKIPYLVSLRTGRKRETKDTFCSCYLISGPVSSPFNFLSLCLFITPFNPFVYLCSVNTLRSNQRLSGYLSTQTVFIIWVLFSYSWFMYRKGIDVCIEKTFI